MGRLHLKADLLDSMVQADTPTNTAAKQKTEKPNSNDWLDSTKVTGSAKGLNTWWTCRLGNLSYTTRSEF